jgi:hypothetical protein
MRDPLKLLAAGFVKSSPITLLALGIFVSLLQFISFYAAAKHEGVLVIRGGIGFLNNFGLLSTLAGNAVLPYLARLYYENVCAFRESKAINRAAPVEKGLSELRRMILLHGRFVLAAYGLVLVGSAFWVANTGIHVFGNVESHWGKVFDSVDHPLGFFLNRANNFYTWMILLPLCGHVMAFSTIQLVRTIATAADSDALKYDLLNPDRCGGYVSIARAHLILNVVIAIVYIQVTLHTETFMRMNLDHATAYAAATLVLLFGNTVFLGGIQRRIRRLRTDALNERKDRVYKNDALSLEILKFFYEHPKNGFSLANFATKTVAVLVPAVMKAAPALFDKAPSFMLL